MPYLFVLLAMLAAIHASFFGLWLIKNSNKKGALAVYGLSIICVALSAYRVVTAK